MANIEDVINPKVIREWMIDKIAQERTDAIELSDLCSIFKDNEEEELEKLSDEQVQQEYTEEFE